MRNHHRSLFLTLISFVFVAASAFAGASAFQQPSQTGPEQKKPATKDEDPVAITERSKSTKPAEVAQIGNDQFGSFGFPVINNRGDVAFVGRFPSSSSPQGFGQAIFVKGADGSWTMVRNGDKAANLGEPILGFNNPTINENGDLTFIASYGTPPPPQKAAAKPEGTLTNTAAVTPQAAPQLPTQSGIFVKTKAGLKMMVHLGQEVPNMPSRFSGFANASSNAKGTLAFVGTYSDPDGRGLMMMEQGKLTIIARSGQRIAPGASEVFSEHYYPAAINERGEIAWFSRISGGGGIFVKRSSGIEAIAIQGKPSPIEGANYIGFGQRAPALGSKGEVVFAGFYDGPDAGRALFFKGEGPVQIVAKSGDNITDTTYNFTDFMSPAINARGDIAFIGSYGGRTRGVFLKTAKGIEIIALAEQKVPGGGKDDVFNNFTQPSLNDRGEVVFLGQLKSGAVGLFIKDASGLKPLVMRGDKLPQVK